MSVVSTSVLAAPAAFGPGGGSLGPALSGGASLFNLSNITQGIGAAANLGAGIARFFSGQNRSSLDRAANASLIIGAFDPSGVITTSVGIAEGIAIPFKIARAREKARRQRRFFRRKLLEFTSPSQFVEALPRGAEARALRRPDAFERSFGIPTPLAAQLAFDETTPRRRPGRGGLDFREIAARFGAGPDSQLIRDELNQRVSTIRSISPAGGQIPAVFAPTRRFQ